MTITVTEFKAKCLQLIEQLRRDGNPVLITKHGQVVAKLVPEHPTKPIGAVRQALARSIKTYRDPFTPAISESAVETFQ